MQTRSNPYIDDKKNHYIFLYNKLLIIGSTIEASLD